MTDTDALDEAVAGAVGTTSLYAVVNYHSGRSSTGELCRDWNALMAAVAKLEERDDIMFFRHWEHNAKGSFAVWASGNASAYDECEALALARCIHAVVKDER